MILPINAGENNQELQNYLKKQGLRESCFTSSIDTS